MTSNTSIGGGTTALGASRLININIQPTMLIILSFIANGNWNQLTTWEFHLIYYMELLFYSSNILELL